MHLGSHASYKMENRQTVTSYSVLERSNQNCKYERMNLSFKMRHSCVFLCQLNLEVNIIDFVSNGKEQVCNEPNF